MIDVVIVGIGFSVVPLIRELEATQTAFTIVSEEGNSVWDRLSQSGRLDFDLVSSYLTSFYSFDLVERYEKDHYPLAPAFYEMHRRWREVLDRRIVRDVVSRVDNFDDHSVVHTQGGRRLEARHVVFATGFRRAILGDLATLDYAAPYRTVVFDTMGDSANLMISHLIARNVKVIIRTNGFHARDKVVPLFGTTYTLDQLEFHNFRYVSHDHYASVIYGAPLGSDNPFLLGDQFPATVRDESHNTSRSRPPSGAVAIKYWPVDEYARMFGADLQGAISGGYVLNDLALWLHTGRAIVVPKDTPIDLDRKTITYGGITRAFDRHVAGDAETPRLPPILIQGSTPYEHRHRDCLMGVVPATLRNVYLIGYTRPYTGGLASIIEMQGLLVHKLITRPEFHERLHVNLDGRIAAYNEHYYGQGPPRRYEHLVHYGFYTDDVARLIGIDHKIGDCKTLEDLLFYYAFPNNAFKYRLRGEYAVPGVAHLVEKMNRQFGYFSVSFAYLLCSAGMDAGARAEWLAQGGRNFFNDMRHKEPYRAFLGDYLEAYRRAKQAHVEEREDREWEALVARACEVRDRTAPQVRTPERCRLDEDLAAGIQQVWSWLMAGHGLDQLDELGLDPRRATLLQAMLNPPEYDLPYLR